MKLTLFITCYTFAVLSSHVPDTSHTYQPPYPPNQPPPHPTPSPIQCTGTSECNANETCCNWNNELSQHTVGICSEICTTEYVASPPTAPVQIPNIYYVSNWKQSYSNGSFHFPFNSIQDCISSCNEGDICILRGGVYYETVSINKNNIKIEKYQDENVILDGTENINTTWTQYTQNIWKTSIPHPVWQLWVDYKYQMTMARWPNIGSHSIWDQEMTWAKGIIDDNSSCKFTKRKDALILKTGLKITQKTHF